jgi:hypothetical protein
MRQPIDNLVPTRAGVVEHMDLVDAPQKMVGTDILIRNPP